MGITVTMLGMGMTLTFDDLRGALAMPKELITGFVLQYSVSFCPTFDFCFFGCWICLGSLVISSTALDVTYIA